MNLPWYMHELKVKERDSGNPTIDSSARFYVWVLEHTSNITSIHFDDKIPDANEIYLEGSKTSKQPIELELWLL